ncbi:MAG: beta-lactamase domain containing protein [Capsulimonas sp.]|nr:beta-lactamase domain containing protein [Capsulimonas sp.]
MNALISRRAFVVTALAALAGFDTGRVEAQVADARPPTVDTSNTAEIAPGVFVLGDHRVWLVPNIGIILGRDAALVVDTGLGPANGEAVLKMARKLAGPHRRLFLTLTHFHPEHGYGAQAFQSDATIIYNWAQRDELAQNGERYLGLFRQTQSKAAAEALRGAKIVMPHKVYKGAFTEIDLGGRLVRLQTWGMAHTRGDQTVFLPKERVLFAGDLIEEGMFPIFPYFPPADTSINAAHWVRILKGFARLQPKVIVPGHGAPGGFPIASALASHIENVGHQVRARRAAGQSTQQILAEYKPQIIKGYPGWEHPGLLDWEIRYFASVIDSA